MHKKSLENRYRSKLILEELENRQLFSDGAAAVAPPPQANDAAATVINVDANIEPVVESQSTSNVSIKNNAETTLDVSNFKDSAAPVSSIAGAEQNNSTDENTNILIDTDCAIATDNLSDETKTGLITNYSKIDVETNNTSLLTEDPLPWGSTETADGIGTPASQPIYS